MQALPFQASAEWKVVPDLGVSHHGESEDISYLSRNISIEVASPRIAGVLYTVAAFAGRLHLRSFGYEFCRKSCSASFCHDLSYSIAEAIHDFTTALT